MKFSLRCPVFPTEDPDLIEQTLSAYFPYSTFFLSDGNREKWFEARFSEVKPLEKLRSTIHELRIIDTTRRVIGSTWTGTMFILRLDKQAAVRRKISLVDELDMPALGFIELTAYCESDEAYESFLKWFTPPTKDGKIIRT